MKTNWQHQKDAITTDKKNRTNDPHVHQEDKQHFQASEKQKRADPDRPEATDEDSQD